MSYYRASIPIQDASADRDTSIYCVQLEGWFLTSLLGLGWALAIDAAWQGTEEEVSLAIDAAEEQMIQLMGVLACNGVSQVGTNKAGYMTALNQDGSTTILGDTYETSQIESFPSEQEVDLPGDNICAGSRMLVERVLADVMFSLDQAQYSIDGFKTGAETASAISKTIPLFNITMGEVFDAWQEWVLSVASLGVSTLKIAFGDPAVKDKMTENIYCKTMDTTNRMFTEETYFDSVNDLPLLESQSSILARFMAGLEVQASGDIYAIAKRWFLLGALNEDNTCEAEFDCTPGWILECDLTLSDGGLGRALGVADGGVYVPGVGWQDTLYIGSGFGHRNIALLGEFPEAIYTGAGMEFTRTAGIIQPVGGADWLLYAGDHAYALIAPTATAPDSPWDVTGEESVGTDARFYIPVGVIESPSDPGGTATMTKVRLYGVGTPPTITGWDLVE